MMLATCGEVERDETATTAAAKRCAKASRIGPAAPIREALERPWRPLWAS